MTKQRKSDKYMKDQAVKRKARTLKQELLETIVTPRKFKERCVNRKKNTKTTH